MPARSTSRRKKKKSLIQGGHTSGWAGAGVWLAGTVVTVGLLAAMWGYLPRGATLDSPRAAKTPTEQAGPQATGAANEAMMEYTYMGQWQGLSLTPSIHLPQWHTVHQYGHTQMMRVDAGGSETPQATEGATEVFLIRPATKEPPNLGVFSYLP